MLSAHDQPSVAGTPGSSIHYCSQCHGTFTVVAAEVCNGLEVGGEPAGQPHQLHVALAFAFQSAAGLNTVEVAVEVQLQQH